MKIPEILRNSLIHYWRWVTEGRKPYRKEQYYHDPYHNEITYDKEKNMYSYEIQTHDSPEGDVWIRGKFKLKFGKIKIIETEKVFH